MADRVQLVAKYKHAHVVYSRAEYMGSTDLVALCLCNDADG
jgi:hypothetical protein